MVVGAGPIGCLHVRLARARGARRVLLAEVNKKWAGLRELFTDADTYVVQVHPDTAEPLRSLAIASCLTIDTIMKQKDTGGSFNIGFGS